MKKIIAITTTVLLCTLCGGCGNMDIIDINWTFDEAIVKYPDGKCERVKIVSWHDYFNGSDMIQIETETQVLCTHSANVILIKNKKKVK